MRLTRKLVLEAPERTEDGAGGFVESWVALGTLWAAVDMRSGREARGEVAALSRAAFRITVRAAPVGAPSRPVAGQRFREGDRVFLVRAVGEADGDARYLMCFAEEETAA